MNQPGSYSQQGPGMASKAMPGFGQVIESFKTIHTGFATTEESGKQKNILINGQTKKEEMACFSQKERDDVHSPSIKEKIMPGVGGVILVCLKTWCPKSQSPESSCIKQCT